METRTLLWQGIRSGLSDWRRSKWLIGGIGLGIAFFITISAIGRSYTELVRMPFKQIESDLLIQLGTQGSSTINANKGNIRLPFSNQEITTQQIETIRSLEGVKALDKAILLWHQKQKNYLTITGISPATAGRGPAMALQKISKGRTLQNSGEAVVESHYARFHSLRPGDTVQIGSRDFEIVGISKGKTGVALAAANYYIDIMDARELAGLQKGSANVLSIKLEPGYEEEAIKATITKLLSGAIVSSTDSIGEMMQGFARISSTGSRILSVLALVFTLLFACWLIIGKQEERHWQIGLLQTLGWQRRDILVHNAAELFVLTGFGVLGGLLLGFLSTSLIGTFEITLELPWNLAPSPEGIGPSKEGTSLQVPLPVIIQPILYTIAFMATCVAGVGSGMWASYRIHSRGVRKTLFANS